MHILIRVRELKENSKSKTLRIFKKKINENERGRINMYTKFNDGNTDNSIALENNILEENLENDIILHSLNAIRSMEIIDIRTGCKLGFVQELVIDIEESKIVSIIIPSAGKNWFNKEEDIEIPWGKVIKAGMDVILVDTSK